MDAGLTVNIGSVESGIMVGLVSHHLSGKLEHIVEQVLGNESTGTDGLTTGILDGTLVVVVGDVRSI